MAPEQVIDYLASDSVGTLLEPAVFDVLTGVVLGRKSLTLTFFE